MKTMKPILSFILLIAIPFNPLYGQVKLRSWFSYQYSQGIAIQDLHDYIPGRGYRGGYVDYRHFFRENFSLGLRVGWNDYKKQYPRAVYDTDKGTVSAVQTKYFYSLPILITAHYYFRKSKYVRPYIGGGLGAYLIHYQKWYGVFNFKRDELNFGINPDVGVMLPFKNSGFGLNISAKYNYAFFSYNEFRNLQYFELAIGIYFGYY